MSKNLLFERRNIAKEEEQNKMFIPFSSQIYMYEYKTKKKSKFNVRLSIIVIIIFFILFFLELSLFEIIQLKMNKKMR